MNKIKLFITLAFCIFLYNTANSQVIWSDDFESSSPSSGDRDLPNHADRDNGSNTSVCSVNSFFYRYQEGSFELDETFSQTTGLYYFRGKNFDNCQSNPDVMDFTGIDISGQQNPMFYGNFGALDSENYEATDYILIEYSVDGGAYTRGLAFASNQSGSGTTGKLAVDTNADDIGDGTILTEFLGTFAFAIPTGNSLNLRVTVRSNQNNEEVAFDDFRVVNNNVTIPNSAYKVGDAIPVTINLGVEGITLNSGTINGVAVTGYSGGAFGNYSATYTVAEGNTDRAAGDDIPVNFVFYYFGSPFLNYTTSISQNADAIDANSPTLSSSFPSDNASNYQVYNKQFYLSFSENIQKGSGNILIKKTSDDSLFESIDVTSDRVSTSLKAATINLTNVFIENTSYYVQVPNTAFTDNRGNPYAGFIDNTTLNFTTSSNFKNSFLNTTASENWTDADNWSLGRVPISSDNVYLTTNVNLNTSNVVINNVSTNAANINILSESSLTVNGNVETEGVPFAISIFSDATSNGSLIVKGTSFLIFFYQRHLTNTNWHLIGAPLSGQSINNFSSSLLTSATNNKSIAIYQNNVASGSRWNYYTTSAGGNNIANAGTFVVGKGYAIKKATAGSLTFEGSIITTDTNVSITDGGDEPNGNRWNLIANPFTSAIHANNAADATNNFLKTNIDAGALDPFRAGLYVWNGTAYEVKSLDDAAFYIAPGQGFFVHAPDGGGTEVTFTKASQTHQTGDVFLRNTTDYPEIVLHLNNQSSNDLTKIRYIENKTTGLDVGSDIGTFTGSDSSLRIYTHLVTDSQVVNLGIQALPNSSYESMVVPVGVKAVAGEEITFHADITNFPSGLKVFLEDREMNTFIQLDEANTSYTITPTTNLDGIGRFYIHTTSSSLSVNLNSPLNNISVYKINDATLRITGLPNEKTKASIFSILGKKVAEYSFISTGIKDIPVQGIPNGVYIIQLKTKSSKQSKKIVLD